MIRLELPYPPSINHYWRAVKGQVLVSAEGRQYKQAVGWLLAPLKLTMMRGRLSVSIIVHVPDRRARDLDNICKPVLDALAIARVYVDDSQIDCITLQRASRVKGGKLIVEIEELP